MAKSEWTKPFAALRQLKLEVASGAVICLTKDTIPLEKNISAIPVGIL
jgi:hypothetical protein